MSTVRAVATADHIFSFRAPRALGDRIRAAEDTYRELAADPQEAAHVSGELEVALIRRLAAAPPGRSHGAFARDLVEAFVEVVEAAVRDSAVASELRGFDAADTGGRRERSAYLRVSPAGLED